MAGSRRLTPSAPSGQSSSPPLVCFLPSLPPSFLFILVSSLLLIGVCLPFSARLGSDAGRPVFPFRGGGRPPAGFLLWISGKQARGLFEFHRAGLGCVGGVESELCGDLAVAGDGEESHGCCCRRRRRLGLQVDRRGDDSICLCFAPTAAAGAGEFPVSSPRLSSTLARTSPLFTLLLCVPLIDSSSCVSTCQWIVIQ